MSRLCDPIRLLIEAPTQRCPWAPQSTDLLEQDALEQDARHWSKCRQAHGRQRERGNTTSRQRERERERKKESTMVNMKRQREGDTKTTKERERESQQKTHDAQTTTDAATEAKRHAAGKQPAEKDCNWTKNLWEFVKSAALT